MTKVSKRISVAMLLTMVLGARLATAAPLPDDNEFQGALAFSMINGTSDGQLATTFQYGRYFTPWFELGARQGFDVRFRDNLSDRWLGTTSPFVNFLYNVDPRQIVVPFVGVSLGVAYNNHGAAGVVAPEAGLKFFLNTQTYVGLAYDYTFLFNDVDNTFDSGFHQVRAQFGFLWGGDRSAESR